jgi:hypothetical protein
VTAQLYFTHCLSADSVEMRGGYCVRATSTADPALFRFAASYPPHELPLDMWSSNPSAGEAPRRLALVAAPTGRALVHSSYLPEDSRGCKKSFFSHYLFVPALPPLPALRTWGSRDWMTAYPPGAPKDLAPPTLPRPGPLHDQAVTAFLSPTGPSNEQALATPLCPARLAPDASKRQELLRRALSGYLLAQQASDAAPRGRFYLLAEPGLAALLLYAIARLLPGPLTADMTFSTYENAHRALRTYRAARVVATYTGSAHKGLEPDCFTTRGYALDTFTDKFSSELVSDEPAALAELIELAARGDWQALDDTYRLLGRNASLAAVAEGRAVAEAERRLKASQATPADLILLRRSDYGRPLLGQYQQIAWPLIRDGSMTDAKLRKEFGDVLLRGLGQLKDRAAEALSRAAREEWRQYWGLIRSALKEDATKLRAALVELVTRAGDGALGLRVALLKDWLDLGPAEPPAVLCQGVPAQALLGGYFTEHVMSNGATPEAVEPFVALFHGLCPVGEQYQDHKARLLAWLDVVETCADPAARAPFQHYYLERHVSAKFRRQLAEEQAARFVPETKDGTAHVTVLAPPRPEGPEPEAEEKALASEAQPRERPEGLAVKLERWMWRLTMAFLAATVGVVGGFLLRNTTANKAADIAAAALASQKDRADEEKANLARKHRAERDSDQRTIEQLKSELGAIQVTLSKAEAKLSSSEDKVRELEGQLAKGKKGAAADLAEARRERDEARKAKEQAEAERKAKGRVVKTQLMLVNRWHSDYKRWSGRLADDLAELCIIEGGDKSYLKDIVAPLSILLHKNREKPMLDLAMALFAFQARYADDDGEVKQLRGPALMQARNALADLFDKTKNKELIQALEDTLKVDSSTPGQQEAWQKMVDAIKLLSKNLRRKASR